VGARDRAGKVKQKKVWAPVFLSFGGSHLMHMHLEGKRLAACSLPSGGQLWLIFSFFVTDV